MVIAKPEWCEIELSGQDEFLILACDGLWEVMTPEDAVQAVLPFLPDLQLGSEKLVETALRLGTTDNVTAIVVSLVKEGDDRKD